MNTDNVKLTPRQKAFARFYTISGCAAKSARMAGYSSNGAKVTGCRLLTNVNLQAELAAQQSKLAEKLDLDRTAIISGVFSGIAQARDSNDAGGIIRGWLAVGKITGLDKPEAAIDPVLSASNSALEARFAEMSEAELMAIAAGRAA